MISRVLMITTAYEQGVGKGHQASRRATEITNPYADSECSEAWALGYKEGETQAARAMLAEPVAWMWPFGRYGSCLTFGGPNSNTPKDWNALPLYTHPQPAQQPLTREQVKEILTEAGYDSANVQARADFINGIRHGERAHDIGGEA